jgi:PAS domain S-box-containing protein
VRLFEQSHKNRRHLPRPSLPGASLKDWVTALGICIRQNEEVTPMEASTPLPPDVVDLEAVITTSELSQRPSRPPDHAAENRALVALAQEMAASPNTILQKLADTALTLCRAQSSGISLLEANGTHFFWPAITGKWAAHAGGGMPREFSPCGTVLDRNAAQLMSHVERHFTYFAPITPWIEEALLVPFYVEGKAVGTIWVISHDQSRRFDAEDLRLMTNLGTFAAAAYQTLQSLNATVAMHWVGPDGIVLWANRTELEMLGYAPEEYIGHHITEFHADAPVIEDILSRLTCGETLREYEARLRCKDGSIRHVLINSNGLFEDGKFVHTRCFTRDITERKRAEQVVRFQAAQLQTLLNNAPLGVYLVDQDFRIREVNPNAMSMFGDIQGGVVGRDLDEIIHILWEEEYADEIISIFRHTLQTGEPYITPERPEYRIDRGVTEYYEWRIDRMPLPDGRFGLVCYFRDISAQVLARATIAESEEHRRRAAKGLRAIAARAHCLLWYAEVEDRGEPDLHWTLWMADEEAARRFLPIKVPLGHTYGRALAEARLPEDRARMAWGDGEIRAGRSYRQEFRVRDAGGDIRWLAEDVQIEAIGPNRWYAVGICVDITERRQAEEEREKHRAEIETLNHRLQRAMAETHHRVKNNLQVISALVDMQSMKHEGVVPAGELNRIGQHIRALATIHDLLTVHAKASSNVESLRTAEVMDKLMPLVQSLAEGRRVSVQVEDIEVPMRQGTSLAVLVNELVSNAVKHGGQEIDVSLTLVRDTARLEVCDDGPGFPPGFDPLKAANTGMELIDSLSRLDLRGTVTYENRSEGGARVVVEFPVTKAARCGEAEPDA